LLVEIRIAIQGVDSHWFQQEALAEA
jgi:hypothetical protein